MRYVKLFVSMVLVSSSLYSMEGKSDRSASLDVPASNVAIRDKFFHDIETGKNDREDIVASLQQKNNEQSIMFERTERSIRFKEYSVSGALLATYMIVFFKGCVDTYGDSELCTVTTGAYFSTMIAIGLTPCAACWLFDYVKRKI